MKGFPFGFMVLVGAIVLITSIILLSGRGEGATITVDDDGGADFERIQDAIDASEQGDTIRIYEGVYKEIVSINTSVDIVGNGSRNTTIDAIGGGEHGLSIVADYVNLSGFTITNASDEKSGIIVSGNHTTIANCSVFQNSGWGIYVVKCNFTVLQFCNISSNRVGGIFAHENSEIQIGNCVVSENQGVGIRFLDCSNLSISDCIVSNSSSSGIFLWDSTFCLISDTQTMNSKSSGIDSNSDEVGIVGCTVENSGSSGIILAGDRCFINNSTIINSSRKGIYLYGKNSRVESSKVENSSEAGLLLSGTNNTVVRVSFLNDGIYTIQNTHTIHNNTVNGKEIYYYKNISGQVVPSHAGQVILSNTTNIIMTNISISNVYYGLIIANSQNCIVNDSNIKNCSAYGIYFSGANNLSINNCTIADITEGAISGWGNSISISNCHIYGGVPTGKGIILMGLVSEIKIKNCTIRNLDTGIDIQAPKNILIENCSIENCYEKGISLNFCSNISIKSCSILSNEIGVYVFSDSEKIVLTMCDLYTNRVYAIQNRNSKSVNVTANIVFWGHASGPYHQTKNEGGKGDNISENVDFNPWLRYPISNLKPLIILASISPSISNEGEVVKFSVEEWDDDGDIIQYQWNSSIEKTFYNGSSPTFTSTNFSNGTHHISIRIMDNFGIWSDEVFFNLTINGRPRVRMDPFFPRNFKEGDTILFKGNATDDDEVVSYRWSSNIDGEFYNGTESSINYSDLSIGTHVISLRVQDSAGIWSEPATITLTVHQQPVALIESIQPLHPNIGETVTFTGIGTDDGSVVLYLWTSSLDGELYNDTSSAFTSTSLSAGTHSISLMVLDDLGVWSEPATQEIEVLNVVDNDIPVVRITSHANWTNVSGTIILRGTATDMIGGIQYVEVSHNNGPWVRAEGTEEWAYTIDTEALGNGHHFFKVRAFDGTDHSENVTVVLAVDRKGEGGDGGGLLPGFGLECLLGAIALVVLLKRR